MLNLMGQQLSAMKTRRTCMGQVEEEEGAVLDLGVYFPIRHVTNRKVMVK